MDLYFTTYCDAVTLTASLVAAGFPQDPSSGARFHGVQSGNITTIESGLTSLTTMPIGPFTIIHGYDDLSSTEIASMTTVINNYNALPPAILAAQNQAAAICATYVALHYNPPTQQLLTTLLTQGIALSYTNRVQYITSALAWVESVTNYLYSIQTSMAACTSVDAVNALTVTIASFSSQFDPTDPSVTAPIAQGMTN